MCMTYFSKNIQKGPVIFLEFSSGSYIGSNFMELINPGRIIKQVIQREWHLPKKKQKYHQNIQICFEGAAEVHQLFTVFSSFRPT